jgi:hypothetical protein
MNAGTYSARQAPPATTEAPVIRSAAAWAVASVASVTSLLVIYVWLRSALVALADNGVGESLITATLAAAYLMPFVLVVVLIAGVPAALLVTISWGYLARVGLVCDSFTSLVRCSLVLGIMVASAFAFAGDVEIIEHPVDSAVTLISIALATSGGLLLPRLLVRSLAPGRFAP